MDGTDLKRMRGGEEMTNKLLLFLLLALLLVAGCNETVDPNPALQNIIYCQEACSSINSTINYMSKTACFCEKVFLLEGAEQ